MAVIASARNDSTLRILPSFRGASSVSAPQKEQHSSSGFQKVGSQRPQTMGMDSMSWIVGLGPGAFGSSTGWFGSFGASEGWSGGLSSGFSS
jgi:hypothetical protein